jgi:hypothetical protein
MRVSRLMCFVGEHHWETVTDAGGALTACTRCGKIRHDYAPSSPRRIATDTEQDARRERNAEGASNGL